VTDGTTAEAGSLAEPAFAVPGDLPDGLQLWLVRHGETVWSAGGRHTGRTDVDITPEGEAQAIALRPLFAALRPARVLCSPRRRATRTALLAGLHVDDVDPDLAEWDYGRFEGLTTPEIREQVPGWSLWTHGVPGGESAGDVTERADRVLRRAVADVRAGPVVLVAHGHISRVMGARWIGLQAADGGRLAFGTAATSILSTQYGAPVIDRWNMPNPSTTNGDSR
jgi:broad specificity phosphatase PhoE